MRGAGRGGALQKGLQRGRSRRGDPGPPFPGHLELGGRGFLRDAQSLGEPPPPRCPPGRVGRLCAPAGGRRAPHRGLGAGRAGRPRAPVPHPGTKGLRSRSDVVLEKGKPGASRAVAPAAPRPVAAKGFRVARRPRAPEGAALCRPHPPPRRRPPPAGGAATPRRDKGRGAVGRGGRPERGRSGGGGARRWGLGGPAPPRPAPRAQRPPRADRVPAPPPSPGRRSRARLPSSALSRGRVPAPARSRPHGPPRPRPPTPPGPPLGSPARRPRLLRGPCGRTNRKVLSAALRCDAVRPRGPPSRRLPGGDLIPRPEVRPPQPCPPLLGLARCWRDGAGLRVTLPFRARDHRGAAVAAAPALRPPRAGLRSLRPRTRRCGPSPAGPDAARRWEPSEAREAR